MLLNFNATASSGETFILEDFKSLLENFSNNNLIISQMVVLKSSSSTPRSKAVQAGAELQRGLLTEIQTEIGDPSKFYSEFTDR